MIGNGKMMYGSHLPHFVKTPEVRVVAVCDVGTTRRAAAKKRVDAAYGNADCTATIDYCEILARADARVQFSAQLAWRAGNFWVLCQHGSPSRLDVTRVSPSRA
jgi:hypothetical protein